MALAGLFLLTSCRGCDSLSEEGKEKGAPPVFTLAPEVERILQKKIELMTTSLKDEAILQSVREANEAHQDISRGEIEKRDRKWRETEGMDEVIRRFFTNKCESSLKAFQGRHGGFLEIFITDRKGLNVCQTNKTSDYYQADESWWLDGYNEGKGHSSYGEIEYDESARSESICLHIPVIDERTGQVVGVAKAVVSLDAVKAEL